MAVTNANIKTYEKNEPGDIHFPRKQVKAEIQNLTLNSSNMIYIPGGADYKKDKIVVLILRDQEA